MAWRSRRGRAASAHGPHSCAVCSLLPPPHVGLTEWTRASRAACSLPPPTAGAHPRQPRRDVPPPREPRRAAVPPLVAAAPLHAQVMAPLPTITRLQPLGGVKGLLTVVCPLAHHLTPPTPHPHTHTPHQAARVRRAARLGAAAVAAALVLHAPPRARRPERLHARHAAVGRVVQPPLLRSAHMVLPVRPRARLARWKAPPCGCLN